MRLFILPIILFVFGANAATDTKGITVSGSCIKRSQPDRGSVILVAQFVNKSGSAAAKRAMETYELLRKAVQQMKLKNLELQTSEYNLQEEFDYQNNKQVSRGYRASLGLQVITSEIGRLGEVAALSSKYEVNRVEGMSTFLSEEKTKEMEEACLVEAIRNARDKAEKMASAASAKVGEVIAIDENADNGRPSPAPYQIAAASAKMMNSAEMASSAPNIESKSSVISVNVQVRFALK